jgi:peptide/nickel transport system substrate-binding protein
MKKWKRYINNKDDCLRGTQMIKKLKSILFITSIFAIGIFGCRTGNRLPDKEKQIGSQIISSDFGEIRMASWPEKNPENARTRNNTLTVGIGMPNGKFNPIFCNSTYDNWVCNLIFEGLIGYDTKGKPAAKLASSWTINDDGKTYNFKLRDNVRFSDGTPLTVEDVKFTYTALCDPNYKGIYENSFKLLEGYEEYAEGNAPEVSGIKIISSNEISFIFTEVRASAINDFAIGILSKKYYSFKKGNIDSLEEKLANPVGTGPYILSAMKKGEEIQFKKNSSYWMGHLNIDSVIMKVNTSNGNMSELINGSIDIAQVLAVPENVNALQGTGFLNLHIYNDNAFQYLGLNLRKDIFMDKRVRQALAYGLNRKAFIEEYYGEYASLINVPFVHISWAYPKISLNEYNYDKEKSKKLLEEIGWKLKSDGVRYNNLGKRLTIRWVTYPGNSYTQKLINRVKDDWGSIGVEVDAESLPFETFTQRVFESQDFDMYNMAWNLGIDPDPSPMFAMAEDVPGGYNSVGWRSPEGEKLIQASLKELNFDKRKRIYEQWAGLINEELPYIFLSENKVIYAVNCRIRNLEVSPYADWTTNINKLIIENK